MLDGLGVGVSRFSVQVQGLELMGRAYKCGCGKEGVWTPRMILLSGRVVGGQLVETCLVSVS